MYQSIRNYLLPISVIGLLSIFIFQSCGSSNDSVVIAGQVIEQSTGSAIKGAVVELTQPADLQQTATTDSAGNFSFSVNINGDATNVTLEISKQDYNTATQSFKVAPGTNVDDLSIELASSTSSGGGGDGNNDAVGGDATGPASIKLKSISTQTINVAETGGTTNSAFTFQVADSAGRTVGQGFEVNFSIIKGPGGGESITPTTGTTNSKGEVTSNLFSGDSSGTVRIEAKIERPEYNITVRSTPVLISIASGFPVKENFHVAPRVHNFDAYGIIDEDHTDKITASVGDLKGNPVKSGTAVYFSASNGALVNGSSPTDEKGYATVNLSANGSTPSGHPMGPGFIDITAQTVDKDNNIIEKKTTLLLTTPRAVISVSPTNLNVSDRGSQTFDVTIKDENGYPMAADTKISVTTGEGLSASGDIVNLELGDYYQAGPGTTDFSVTISDSDVDHYTPTDGSFTITVTTPSGEVTSKTVKGNRAKTK